MEKVSVFWFRRDLRLDDNAALSQALLADLPVLPVFIFDTEILSRLVDKHDRRVDYIYQAVTLISHQLHLKGSDILVTKGAPLNVFDGICQKYDVQNVFCNTDYEPAAIKRDNEVMSWLSTKNIKFIQTKDQVVFEKNEIVKDDGTPYTVYTPYAKKWVTTLTSAFYKPYNCDVGQYLKMEKLVHPSLEDIGFEKTDFEMELPTLNADIIDNYDRSRDFPALDRTTYLGTALRFGTISIRKCVAFALKHNATWLSELIWREFFMQILYHFPQVEKHCFKPKYEKIPWRNNEAEFDAWCQGETGYPIVDAGMHQLNQTGFMHNRVRMIVASFLTKHLLIDWRWGEAYFADKLLDYDLAANNGNWQWSEGCGCDAAPYFRIFNPDEQTKKFDKNLEYVRRWNPDFDQSLKPRIVEHTYARERALSAYKKALNG